MGKHFFDSKFDMIYKNAFQKILEGWHYLNKKQILSKKNILPSKDKDKLQMMIQECLDLKGGEVTARKRTIELGYYYLDLSDEEKKHFLKILATKFDINDELLHEKLTNLLLIKDKNKIANSRYEIKELLEPSRVNLLRQFLSFDQGIKFLVDLRSDLITLNKEKDTDLSGLEKDLKFLLSQLFDIGLLDIREIDWNCPASLLEKLIIYEAVHAIKSWTDLKNRLDRDRKCYAFFHHKMPTEPLIFIEVAFSTHFVSKIDELLDESAPLTETSSANYAVFYSISNTQRGLGGISFGNFLIKQVVEKVSREYPNIENFITLSPIPNFGNWVKNEMIEDKNIKFTSWQMELLSNAKNNDQAKENLLSLLQNDWSSNKDQKNILEQILPMLCAYYLVHAKKDGKSYDPVAHFHLSNGARIENINFGADFSKKAILASYSLMVNYRYILPEIDDNHENYNNGIVKYSDNIARLLQSCK